MEKEFFKYYRLHDPIGTCQCWVLWLWLNHTVVKRNHGIKKFQESSIVINARGGRMLGIQILYLKNKMT
jgi:hypothetical protein